MWAYENIVPLTLNGYFEIKIIIKMMSYITSVMISFRLKKIRKWHLLFSIFAFDDKEVW